MFKDAGLRGLLIMRSKGGNGGMKIIATVEVPDGDKCSDGCDLWYRAEDKRCYCLLFGMIELTERYKENMVSGTDVIKCFDCQTSIVQRNPAWRGVI